MVKGREEAMREGMTREERRKKKRRKRRRSQKTSSPSWRKVCSCRSYYGGESTFSIPWLVCGLQLCLSFRHTRAFVVKVLPMDLYSLRYSYHNICSDLAAKLFCVEKDWG